MTSQDTPELVERVARAICAHMSRKHFDTLAGDAAFPPWQEFVTLARAAIEAMREPTEAMRGAGGAAIDAQSLYRPKTHADRAWRAMIAAALEPRR